MRLNRHNKIISVILITFFIQGCEVTNETRKSAPNVSRFKIAVVNQKNIQTLQYLEEARNLMDEKRIEEAHNVYKKVLILDPENEEALAKIQEIQRWMPVVEQKTKIVKQKEKEISKTKQAYINERNKAAKLAAKSKVMINKIKEQEIEKKKLLMQAGVLKAVKDARTFAFYHKFRKAEEVLRSAFMKYPSEAEKIEKALVEIRNAEKSWKKAQVERIAEKQRLKELEKKLKEKGVPVISNKKDKKKTVFVKKKTQKLNDIIDEQYLFESLPKKLTHKDKIEFLEEKTYMIYSKALVRAYDWVANYHHYTEPNLPRAFHFYKKLLKNFPESKYQEKANKALKVINKKLHGVKKLKIRKSEEVEIETEASLREKDKKEEILNMYLENMASAYLWIGSYFRAKGRFEEAIHYYQQIQEDIPESELADDAVLAIAEIYYEQGRLESAMLQYHAVTDNYPSSNLYRQVNMRLAKIYRRQGKYAKALNYYKDLGDISRDSETITLLDLETAKLHIEAEQFSEAITLLAKILKGDATSKYYEETEFYYGYAFFKKGDYDKCRKIFNQIKEGYSFNSYRDDAIFAIAESYFKEENFASCIEAIDTAREYYPEYVELDRYLIMLGDCFMEISRYDKAEEAYKKVVEIFPGGIFIYKAYYGMGMALFQQNRLNDSKKYFMRVIGDFPETDRAVLSRIELGRIYMEQGDCKLANRQFALAIKNLEPGIKALRIQYYRAVCFERSNKSDRSLKIIENTDKEYKELLSEEEAFPEEEINEIKSYLYMLRIEQAKISYENKNFAEAIELY